MAFWQNTYRLRMLSFVNKHLTKRQFYPTKKLYLSRNDFTRKKGEYYE